jgi:hypothetical protein
MADLPLRDAALLLDMLLVWNVVQTHLDSLIAIIEALVPGEEAEGA